MSRDKLFLIEPGFQDAQKPGERFVCPHCNQVEGLLSAFPDLATRLDVERIPFARPRKPVIALLGEDNQSLPLLILGKEAPIPADAEHYGENAFVNTTARILELLSERHGFPRLHE
ncbi:DUF3088 domain-containing protein [Beijerinckia indica]|uniref:DUF3088 domain-containing protein n=1 Tax=Beijerinckia indica subsp. indica (strain ATCC 9039 / DSM 1715 / NCIMB 8712) TaxID=395963 RepID=B2IDN8_BEII9|nr:DUF3088 domain-containing protein [Beijerinckia indica]ACB95474.1 conserved hypothetical protein [Beijerinckia indica subsp. indica ATCC 9039]